MANDEHIVIEKLQRGIKDAIGHYQVLIDQNGDASSVPRHLTRLEGQEVTDFSSQYGGENSFSYVASNLAGKTSVFPAYGDFINACVFRTYGPWWSIAPSGMRKYKGTPSSFVSVDFIEVMFNQVLYPVNIEVYETYNSGSIVKICACDRQAGTSVDCGRVKWVTLWEGSPQPHMKPRIFSPPLKAVDFATNLIRLELNHDGQDYYTELDGIRLVGSKTPGAKNGGLANGDGIKTETKTDSLIVEEISEDFEKLSTTKSDCDTIDASTDCYFTFLPEEIIQLLLSYLDTRDLCRLSQTCRFLRDQCYDPLLYTDLNLQPFWSQVVSNTFQHLKSRCKSLKRLNISWCGKGGTINENYLEGFLWGCNTTIETLEMASCPFLTHTVLTEIMSICINLKELNLQSCTWIADFTVFRKIPLKNLRRLNLYRTRIDEESLKSVFRTSVDLEHLNIGSCIKLSTTINSVLMELTKNCRNMKSLDMWRMKSLTYEGFSLLYTNCVLLEEIDVGWCTALKADTNCFIKLASACKNLKKLYLTANRTVNDKDVRAFTDNCPLLEQLDILGTREVSKPIILRLLDQCKNMKMLDVSFCVGINFADVLAWRNMFPRVSIKKSFQNVSEL